MTLCRDAVHHVSTGIITNKSKKHVPVPDRRIPRVPRPDGGGDGRLVPPHLQVVRRGCRDFGVRVVGGIDTGRGEEPQEDGVR